MKKFFLASLCLFIAIHYTYAQNKITVSGKVFDKDLGQVVIGANILEKGTDNGTVTNVDGMYSISVSSGATLVFSYVGMQTQEVKVNGRQTIDVVLIADAKTLDDVVVIGYGTIRKRDLTGSIVSVKGDEIKSNPSISPLSALQGKVPGMDVITQGNAGASPKITIRGIGSMANSNPYYIVDGMFTDNIDFVNTSDIASVEVLKDASSLAMFGVKGANGIIIITTKRGQEGKVTFNVDSYTGFQTIMPGDKLKLADGNQFTEWYRELLTNSKQDILDDDPDAIIDASKYSFNPQVPGVGTNWVDQVTRSALITSQSISASTASEKSHSFFSLSYFKQDGVVKYDNYERYTARFNTDYKFNNWAKLGGNVALSYWGKDTGLKGYGDLLTQAVHAMPTYAPKDNDGNWMMPDRVVQGQINNPVATMEIGSHNNKSWGYRILGNAFLDIVLFKKLTYHGSAYVDLGMNQNKVFKEKFFLDSMHKQEATAMNRDQTEYRTFQQEHTLTWDDVIGDHRFNVMLGFTSNYVASEGFSAGRDSINVAGNMDYVPEELQMLGMGIKSTATNGDSFSEESQLSYFGRVNYSYKDRYIIAATLRRDGSSKFLKKNRWGTFPSVGLGWVISEEDFIRDNTSKIDFLKLKGSWGRLGNDRASGRYDYYRFVDPNGSYAVFGNSIITIPTLTSMADLNLTWEKMEGTEVGLEGSFLNQRLSGEFTFFNRKTRDFLTQVPVPASIGSGYMITNAGSMRNRGIELSLNYSDVAGNLRYTIGGNFTYTQNKVLSLGSGGSDKFSGPCITRVGETIASFYGYKTDGIFQNQAEIDNYVNDKGVKYQPDAKPGDFKWKDVDGNGVIDDNDRTILGSYFAPFSFGVNVKLEYKGFDLGVDITGVAGNEIYNSKKAPYDYNQFNFMECWENRWHGEGTSNKYPILSNMRPDNMRASDFFVENGSYVRLRNVQLGYTFPKAWMHKIYLNSLRIYASAQNLLTLTAFDGWTPEIGGSPLESGVDSGSLYPLPATITFGLNLTF